jgi:hypothetical protein
MQMAAQQVDQNLRATLAAEQAQERAMQAAAKAGQIVNFQIAAYNVNLLVAAREAMFAAQSRMEREQRIRERQMQEATQGQDQQ